MAGQQDVVVVGTRPHPVRDAYRLVLRMPWGLLVATIGGVVLLVNLVFALILSTGHRRRRRRRAGLAS